MSKLGTLVENLQAEIDRWKREALAARELLRFYGVLVQLLSKTDREAEAAIETLHEKYAQERISRSRQTLSDNTKMENQ